MPEMAKKFFAEAMQKCGETKAALEDHMKRLASKRKGAESALASVAGDSNGNNGLASALPGEPPAPL